MSRSGHLKHEWEDPAILLELLVASSSTIVVELTVGGSAPHLANEMTVGFNSREQVRTSGYSGFRGFSGTGIWGFLVLGLYQYPGLGFSLVLRSGTRIVLLALEFCKILIWPDLAAG